ncbi:zinc finger autosomal protein-like isoform X2 [Zophobas morio]|uniref:zinc finger autosomal protein-like isoform X2 n=1 Tax=Zophobas morio TaxID=2755281 RepID=UPI003083610E
MMAALESSENDPRMGLLSNKVHNCKNCPFSSTSLFRMVNHVRTHRSPLTHFNCEKSNVDLYFCKDCNFQTDLTLLMKKHIENYHAPHPQNATNSLEEDEIQSYICKKCGFETYFLLKWLQHAQMCPGPKKKLQFSYTDTMRWGQYKNWSFKSPSMIKTEKCDNDVFTEIKDLNEDSVKWRECNHCSFRTLRKYALKRHMVNIHFSEDHTEWHHCDQCPFKAKFHYRLNRHIRTRHLKNTEKANFTWYKCAHCRLKTASLEFLNTHVSEKHKKADAEYQCEQCSYKATRKDLLTRHTRNVHHRDQINQFQCDQCPYKATRKDYLKRHIVKIHKPDQVRFEQHVLGHHLFEGNMAYKCGLCNFQSSTQELGKHILERHVNSGK